MKKIGFRKFLGKKMTCQKKFLVQKMSGSNKFWVQNDLGPKKCWVQRDLELKKFWFKKFGSKRNYHLKSLLKEFKSKQILSKFWVQKRNKFESKRFGVKILVQKIWLKTELSFKKLLKDF